MSTVSDFSLCAPISLQSKVFRVTGTHLYNFYVGSKEDIFDIDAALQGAFYSCLSTHVVPAIFFSLKVIFKIPYETEIAHMTNIMKHLETELPEQKDDGEMQVNH